MKQIEGNSPKCSSCYYFTEKEPNDGCLHDGWCGELHQCMYYGNGKKREKRLVRCQTEWNSWCRYWEDAEDRISYFDYVTGRYRDMNIQKKLEV